MKLKSLSVALTMAMIPLALFWGCGKGSQPLSPVNSSGGLSIKLTSNSSAQFVAAAENTILYNFSGSGAPVTGSYGPLSASAITGGVNFSVSLPPGSLSSYKLISVQINNTATGQPLALGASLLSPSEAPSVELAPLNKTCYEVTNLPAGTFYSFQNYVLSTSSTSTSDIESVLTSSDTGFELDATTSSATGVAYLGNGNLVNFDLVPPSANFKSQSSASKEFVLKGSTSTPQAFPISLNDVYCVKLSTGGYAWVQITNAGTVTQLNGVVISIGPSFVFRLNTTLPYFAYQQSTSDLNGECGSSSLSTPTPYAPTASSASGLFTGNVYGIAVYPSTSAALSIFASNDPMVNASVNTDTAYVQVLNPSLTANTTFATGTDWAQGIAVNSTGTTIFVASTYSQGSPTVQMYGGAGITSIGPVGAGVTFNPPDNSTQALAGKMGAPEFVAVAPNSGTYPNGLFVTDSATNDIADVLVFNFPPANGAAVTYWNGQIGASTSPTGIATDGTTVYVADSENNQIEIYTINGVLSNAWGTDNNPAGRTNFSGPQGIAVDPALGEIFIADTNNNRVVEMTTAGVFKAAWGTWGLGTGVTPSTFNLPNAIAVDGATPPNVFVADSANKRVLKFLGL